MTVPTQDVDSAKFYRRDLVLTVNGVTREGSLVMGLKPDNVIRIWSPVDMDFFSMSNCAGERVKPKIAITTTEKRFFFWTKTVESKREAEFHYYPTDLETGHCPLQLYAVNSKGVPAFGMVDFQTPNFNLNGEMLCNGEKRAFDGAEICQSRAGLFQRLTFPDTVRTSPDAECSIGSQEGKVFEFPMNRGACVYQFRSLDGKLKGKLTTIGYDDYLIRE